MTLQDIVEKGVATAKEIGNILKNAFLTLYNTDVDVIGKYALILAIAVLLIFGLGILSAELEVYRVRNENESKKLPWYLRARALFVAIILLYTVIFVLIF
jgi:hypothetical protein